MQTTVENIDEETTIGRDGKVQRSMRLRFRVGDHGPFFVTVPKDGYTAELGRAEVEKIAAQVRATVGA